MIEEIIKIFIRDLTQLQDEIAAYKNEDDLWRITGNVKNPAGNLCLHLVGNLNTYIGKQLGNTNYVRNRDAEFALKNIPKTELIDKVERTRLMIQEVLANIKNDDLQKIYPENVLGYEMTTGFFLIHLCAHLSYHLGQINYLRRILE
jgi:hypothetical protein